MTVGTLCLLGGLLATGARAAEPPLRLHLEVGDRLVYERRVRVSQLASPSRPVQHQEQLQLWCLARENDECLVLGEMVRVIDARPGLTHGALFLVDDRGRRQFPPEILARITEFDPLFELIPILPAAIESAPTWLSEPDHFGRRWRCTRVAADASGDGTVRVDFTLEDPTGVTAARGIEQHGAFWFDPEAGLVVRVETETRDTPGDRHVLAVTRLYTQTTQRPHWCEQRLDEAQRYRRTQRLEDRLLEGITREPDQIEEIISSVERFWSELIAQMPTGTQSPFHRLARTRIATLAEEKTRYRERAELTRRWLGSTAAHWSLQTPDGGTTRSEAVRDRLVVECFWSADSLTSLRSFAILRDLQRQLPADRFRVICLNIDADADAGRRAARLCGAELTHVLSGPPLGGQAPAELPVFRVLDAESRIRAVFFGWQPALAEKLLPLTAE